MGLFSALRALFSSSTYNVLEDAPALTPAQDRGLALGAMYAVEGHLPINALTMEADPRTAGKLAAGPWDAVDPESARANYRFLLSGGHDTAWQVVLPYLDAYLKMLPDAKRREPDQERRRGQDELPAVAAASGLDARVLTPQYTSATYYFGAHSFRKDAEPLPRSIVAWDAARVVHVSRIFLDAGLVTPDEAWAAIDQAVHLARAAYPGWAEYESAFRAGRVFWMMGNQPFDADDAEIDANQFKEAGKTLLTDEDSPWLRLSW